jgi:hypothetical protein
MRLAARTKAAFGVATVLSLAGVAAWAQNLEVKGHAWFATGDQAGRAGVGTANPVGKLHVVSSGGFASDDSEGRTPPSGVPLVAQSDSTAIGVLNSHGRAAFALNIDGNGATDTARGSPVFYDKTDGNWHASLWLKNGDIGTNGSVIVGGGVSATTVSTGILSASGELTSSSAAVSGRFSAGQITAREALWLDNSDLYFSNTAHNHTGKGNTTGYAAIENAANFGTLMILGRAGTSVGRRVDVWDYLQVNGDETVTGNLQVNGTVSANKVTTKVLALDQPYCIIKNANQCPTGYWKSMYTIAGWELCCYP